MDKIRLRIPRKYQKWSVLSGLVFLLLIGGFCVYQQTMPTANDAKNSPTIVIDAGHGGMVNGRKKK